MQHTSLTLLALVSYCSSVAQTPTVKWWYDLNDMAFGQAASADVDNDGKLEIAFSTYRNDSTLYVLNAENGSLKWKYNTGGCNDVAPLIYDVDRDGDLEIVLPGSCNPVTFCFDADSGFIEWQTPMRGSDSPPTIGDLDGDGTLEILHGEFNGYVLCINGEDGTVAWELSVDSNCWIQTEPALLDADGNGQLDFIVANWSFGTNHRIWCYRGADTSIMWQDTLPDDVMYHGAAFGDMDNDGLPEITLGDYSGALYCLNANDGSLKWEYSLPNPFYIGAPTSMADLNSDGKLDVVFSDGATVAAVSDSGTLMWDYDIPGFGSSFRGAVIVDVNNDNILDVTFGTSSGLVVSLDGLTGTFIRSIDLEAHYGADFDIDHAPILADFDSDGILDVFVVGGHAEYPNIQNNYGRAYAIEWGTGHGPEWRMFRRDHHRSACLCNDSLLSSVLPVTSQGIEATIFPNPVVDVAYLRMTLTEPLRLRIELSDLAGRRISERHLPLLSAGTHDILLGPQMLERLLAGFYLLRLESEAASTTLRLVIGHQFVSAP